MGLLELIVQTGIADAIASQLGGLKGNRNASAETIENNVRLKILREHLSDPAYYEKMSALLDEIIATRKAKAIEYEEYLQRIAALAKRVEAGVAEDTPAPLRNSPGLRALYNNLKTARPTPPRADRVAESKAEYTVSSDPVLDLALYDTPTTGRLPVVIDANGQLGMAALPVTFIGRPVQSGTEPPALVAPLQQQVADLTARLARLEPLVGLAGRK
jgi:type I restriction enzyme R subunit